ncbi:MAG: mandelate racemase/muconate lactonizing enzyme family protein [Alphaproteobacteria bacterium]|nr:mandelate racemase/muconate lactonizing enzyme family protein [Alphaproteobacteria bacterium]
MRIREVTLYRAELPLVTPYRLSYRTFESFEPLIVEIRDEDGREGWGEQHISPGSSAETRDGGWAFARELASQLPGLATDAARRLIAGRAAESKVAATALTTAIELLEDAPLLHTGRETRQRLLTPFNATARAAVEEEVEERLTQGFRTFKVKVGQDVAADIERLGWIQQAAAGRATLRIDANRAYNREDGCRFASAIDPHGIELFEQPCAAEDWDANAAVAAVSQVPLMLDEPICDLPDIDRAAAIPGVGLCKVKLKRFGSVSNLRAAIERVQASGLQAVLGDGLGAEINCWMEARVADRLIDNAGEFNGFVKVRPEARLLADPLPFEAGELVIPADWWPKMDRARLAERTIARERFAPATA